MQIVPTTATATTTHNPRSLKELAIDALKDNLKDDKSTKRELKHLLPKTVIQEIYRPPEPVITIQPSSVAQGRITNTARSDFTKGCITSTLTVTSCIPCMASMIGWGAYALTIAPVPLWSVCVPAVILTSGGLASMAVTGVCATHVARKAFANNGW